MIGAIEIVRADRFRQVERPTKIGSGLIDAYSPNRSSEHAIGRDPACYVRVQHNSLFDIAGELKRGKMAGRRPRKSRHHISQLRNDQPRRGRQPLGDAVGDGGIDCPQRVGNSEDRPKSRISQIRLGVAIGVV